KGATGAGKTSLFQLIPKLSQAKKGKVFIDGIPLDDYTAKQFRESSGYIPTTPVLATGTVGDAFRFGSADDMLDEVSTVAITAKIHDSIEEFPNGYESIVGQKGVNLSGGQKQRVSIARALVRYPKILMFDDSTSALDLNTEQNLLNALHDYDCS